MEPERQERSHYFDAEPAVGSRPAMASLALPDVKLDLMTDRGVFSHGAIDAGTKLLLLEAPPPPASGHVLDLGCGYGAIALTIATRSPDATVWAVDVNRRALALTAQNAERARLANVRTATPEEVPTGVTFAAIYSNPPVRVGKAALRELVGGWLARLERPGAAYLVIRRDLGADSFARWLSEEGRRVRRIASRVGYRVLEVLP